MAAGEQSEQEPKAPDIESLDNLSKQVSKIADAIARSDCATWATPDGGQGGSLTEAILYVGNGLRDIAEAINNVGRMISIAVRKDND